MRRLGGTARADLTALLVAAALVVGGQALAGPSAAPSHHRSPAAAATSERLFLVRPQVSGAEQLATRGRGAGRAGGPAPWVFVAAVAIALALVAFSARRATRRGGASMWWAGRALWRAPPAISFV